MSSRIFTLVLLFSLFLATDVMAQFGVGGSAVLRSEQSNVHLAWHGQYDHYLSDNFMVGTRLTAGYSKEFMQFSGVSSDRSGYVEDQIFDVSLRGMAQYELGFFIPFYGLGMGYESFNRTAISNTAFTGPDANDGAFVIDNVVGFFIEMNRVFRPFVEYQYRVHITDSEVMPTNFSILSAGMHLRFR